MTSKHPHPIDRLVGLRVRTLRTGQGLSQSNLAHELGITFQQVQKYENGSNRISASKLFEISRVLRVGVEELYGGAEETGSAAVNFATPGSLPSLLDHKIIRALSRIDDDHVKRKVLALIRTLAPDSDDAEA